MAEARLLTIEETAKRLRISRSKCYELAQRGELPGVKRFGRAVRISEPALNAWIAAYAQEPQAPWEDA